MEYTDLELNKMIAELEGEVVIGGKHHVYVKCQPSLVGNVQYSPIEDKFLLFDLIVKYKVDIVHRKSLSTVRIYNDPEDNPVASIDFYHEDVSYGKAIIMCILKSKNIT